jgi:formamidopyrimidine-DNA glycosylase
VPELPEVETVRRQLAGSVLGWRFEVVEKVESSMLRDSTEQQLRDLLPDSRIEALDRLGKFLVMGLSDAKYLTFHLGMTGSLRFLPRSEVHSARHDPSDASAQNYTRFVFHLSGKENQRALLEFRDMRKFGRLHLTVGEPAPRLQNLGPDAWQGSWDEAYLKERLRGRMSPLKAFLLDQRHLAGIGNIYADEILWWTRLSPLRAAGSLSSEEVIRLEHEIPRRLGEGVRLLGCSIADFVDTQGKEGKFQEWLRAYGKHGQPCSRCGLPMARVVVVGRGTTFCPGCQK